MTYLYALIALQVADLLTTYYIIKNGGREVNPLLVKLAELTKTFTNARWAWLVIAKVFGAAGSIYVALTWPDGAIGLIVIYSLVVVSNLNEIRKKW
jgi:hypothetical protein